MHCWSSGSDDLDEHLCSINDDSCGGILLEELGHMRLNKFSQRPKKKKIAEQPKAKADQSEKERKNSSIGGKQCGQPLLLFLFESR